MFGRHGCMGFNHCIVPTQVKWIPKIFKLVSLGEVGCHSSVDRHPAVLILAFLVSVSRTLWTVAYASEIWNSGLFKLLPMCACFTLDVFWYFFSPSSRKWVFLLSWLFVEWPPMVLRSRTRMTEECWISAASIREPWMSFETSLWIWFKFRHLLFPVGPLLAADFTLGTPSQIHFISYGILHTYQNATGGGGTSSISD